MKNILLKIILVKTKTRIENSEIILFQNEGRNMWKRNKLKINRQKMKGIKSKKKKKKNKKFNFIHN